MTGSCPVGMSVIGGDDLVAMLRRLDGLPVALLALGMPRCPACDILPASLTEIARARPDLPIAVCTMDRAEHWALREEHLWPRGIRVSRASVPVLALVAHGRAVAVRQGGGPASVIDAWLAERLGPAADPLATGVTAGEQALLQASAARRAQQAVVKERR